MQQQSTNPGATGLSKEMTEPLVFFKPSTSVIGPNEDIISPMSGLKVWGECELGIVIGQTSQECRLSESRREYFWLHHRQRCFC